MLWVTWDWISLKYHKVAEYEVLNFIRKSWKKEPGENSVGDIPNTCEHRDWFYQFFILSVFHAWMLNDWKHGESWCKCNNLCNDKRGIVFEKWCRALFRFSRRSSVTFLRCVLVWQALIFLSEQETEQSWIFYGKRIARKMNSSRDEWGTWQHPSFHPNVFFSCLGEKQGFEPLLDTTPSRSSYQ